MQNLLSNKTVSMTELRDPAKVIEKAGSSPVAVLNRNKVVGYFVPNEAVQDVSFEVAPEGMVLAALDTAKDEMAPVLDYLKDK